MKQWRVVNVIGRLVCSMYPNSGKEEQVYGLLWLVHTSQYKRSL